MQASQCIWLGEMVKPIELDETGRWVTVQLVSTGAFHTACVDDLQGFDVNSVPKVKWSLALGLHK